MICELRMPLVKHGGLFILILFLQQNSGNSQDTCQPKSDFGRIKKQILSGYDKTVRPVLSVTQTINTTVFMYMQSLDFDEEKRVLNVFSSLWVEWKDEFLQRPSQGADLDRYPITMSSEEIWTPDLIVSTSHEGGQMSGSKPGLPPTMCWLSESRSVHCVPQVMFKAHCVPDLSRWPMDEHSCIMEVGSWTETTNGIHLVVRGRGIYGPLQAGNKWALLKAQAAVTVYPSLQNVTYDVIRYSFTIRRHSGAHLATVVIPAFVLSLMTLLMPFLEAGCPERITLGCTNALAHCLYLQYLGLKLPPNGDSVPAIVAFFRDSMFLVGASLALSVFVRGLAGARTQVPAWLSALLSTPPGRLLQFSYLSSTSAAGNSEPAPDGEGADPQSDQERTWQRAALLLDRIALVLFLIALAALLVNYVP